MTPKITEVVEPVDEKVEQASGREVEVVDKNHPDVQSNYLSFNVGEDQTIVFDRLEKIKNPNSRFNYTDRKGKNFGYRHEVVSKEEKRISCNAWTFWNVIKQGLNNDIIVEGKKLKFMHPAQGEYRIEEVD